MRYKILEADTARKLEEMVRQDIVAGWELVGGLNVCAINSFNARENSWESYYSYAQAMSHYA